MYWRLDDSVTACRSADRILFLNVGRDRYLTLPPSLNEPFAAWLSAPADAVPEALGAVLGQLDINPMQVAAAGLPAEVLVPKPSPIDSEQLPGRPVRAGDLLSVGRAVVSAARDVRARPLKDVLARRFAGRSPAEPPAPDLKSRLAVFRSVRPLIPVPRVCLHDCLALLDWLGPGSGVTLTFGVSAYPFAAHTWLQAGDRVLDDHPESPSRFEPILQLP